MKKFTASVALTLCLAPPTQGRAEAEFDKLLQELRHGMSYSERVPRAKYASKEIELLMGILVDDADYNCGDVAWALFVGPVERGHLIKVACKSGYDFAVTITPKEKVLVTPWQPWYD